MNTFTASPSAEERGQRYNNLRRLSSFYLKKLIFFFQNRISSILKPQLFSLTSRKKFNASSLKLGEDTADFQECQEKMCFLFDYFTKDHPGKGE